MGRLLEQRVLGENKKIRKRAKTKRKDKKIRQQE